MSKKGKKYIKFLKKYQNGKDILIMITNLDDWLLLENMATTQTLK